MNLFCTLHKFVNTAPYFPKRTQPYSNLCTSPQGFLAMKFAHLITDSNHNDKTNDTNNNGNKGNNSNNSERKYLCSTPDTLSATTSPISATKNNARTSGTLKQSTTEESLIPDGSCDMSGAEYHLTSDFPQGLNFCCIDDSCIARHLFSSFCYKYTAPGTVKTFGALEEDVSDFVETALQNADIVFVDHILNFEGVCYRGIDVVQHLQQHNFQVGV